MTGRAAGDEVIRMKYLPIERHGIIGDMHTAALVGCDGSIDFMCFPVFDSPSVFASLLDAERGGVFRIAPVAENGTQRQVYLPDTNILLTQFTTDSGMAELTDFMEVGAAGQPRRIVRMLRSLHGRIRFGLHCDPRFEYGTGTHDTVRKNCGVLFDRTAASGPGMYLKVPVPFRVRDGAVNAEFSLENGEEAVFVLEELREGEPPESAHEGYGRAAFGNTLEYWRNWIAGSTYTGRWREAVHRSALTLKLLTSQPHGSIVASPTFGLPEKVGGARNWDYRYAWIRDASFVVYALMRIGFTRETSAFIDWIEARCRDLNPDGSLQAMYGIDGRHDLSERVLDQFEGYRGSSPVRIGNAAWNQLQLDIYGALIDSIYLFNKYADPISFDLWQYIVRLVEYVCGHWNLPDEGIWEIRGERREFIHSRVMCWVALDRALRIAAKRSFPAPLDRWTEVRNRIYMDVMENFWNPRLGAFVQYRGADRLDAAQLLTPLVKFVGPGDPRWISTLRAIERELTVDALVYRYSNRELDGLPGDEGTFSICSFWYAECLSRSRNLEKARLVFEKAIGYANPLGLFAEELGAHGEHLGNFPQAFTHLGLISAAYNLDRMLDESERKTGTDPWSG